MSFGAIRMPSVSVIVPCYNEQTTIRLLLEAVYSQSYPLEQMEVVIADGMSTDRTREEIANFQLTHPELPIRIVDNPDRVIPAALNRAIRAAQGEFLVRLDAHSAPKSDYIARCVEALKAGRGENVGGVWKIRPGGIGWIADSIAYAASHPLGVGDANYRVGGQAQLVDTVPFGAFRRSLVEQIGGFDETLLTNEDYEFNARVRKSGHSVWFDPEIESTYFARSTLKALSRQYWRYGYWKARMLLRHPETFRWRQLAGVFVLSWVLLGILALWFPIAGLLLFIEAVIYGFALGITGLHAAWLKRNTFMLLGVPLAIAVMHFSWGSGFLWSLITFVQSKLLSLQK